jgi:hypothetical protein
MIGDFVVHCAFQHLLAGDATVPSEKKALKDTFDKYAESRLLTPGGHNMGVGKKCILRKFEKTKHHDLLGDTFDTAKRRVTRQRAAAAAAAAAALKAAALEAMQTPFMCVARAAGSSLLVPISRLPVAGNSSV